MNKAVIGVAGILATISVQAEDLDGVERMVCAATQVQVCIENDSCYQVSPDELGVPDFVIIDTSKRSVSTTKASKEYRSTGFSTVAEQSDRLYLQGMERGRAFSFVIDKATGRMTVAVSRDGLSVSVFGSCTDAEL